jgi:hypothetical protein
MHHPQMVTKAPYRCLNMHIQKHTPFMQRIMKPNGSSGSIRDRSLEGDGTNDTNTGT